MQSVEKKERINYNEHEENVRIGGKSMDQIILYHGSNVEVARPCILQNGFYKDFGYGFYCTNLEKQAKRWAISRNGDSILNKYKYQKDPDLNKLCFEEMADDWLDFVAECRNGKEHGYDIVEGPMADDQIWNYVENFLSGKIPREAFWTLVKFNHPTHQIVFCTQNALRTLSFEGSEKI